VQAGRAASHAIRAHQKLATVRPVGLASVMSVPLFVRLVFWAWFAAAVYIGQQRVLQRLPPPAVQGILFGLTALVLLGYFRVAALRDWFDRLDLRHLVLVHVSRLVGLYFLLLYARGELPYAFAVPAGIGDILVALAAVLIVFLRMGYERRQALISLWNVIGFVDIMLVVATAIRLNLTDAAQLRALTHLPLSLLPTFLVPLIIATHVIIFTRIARARAAAGADRR
jgi:hypothetical protein